MVSSPGVSRLSTTSAAPDTISTSLPPAPKLGGNPQPRPRKGGSVGIDARPLEHDLARRLEREVLAGLDGNPVLAEHDAVGVAVAQPDLALVVVEGEHGRRGLEAHDRLFLV